MKKPRPSEEDLRRVLDAFDDSTGFLDASQGTPVKSKVFEEISASPTPGIASSSIASPAHAPSETDGTAAPVSVSESSKKTKDKDKKKNKEKDKVKEKESEISKKSTKAFKDKKKK